MKKNLCILGTLTLMGILLCYQKLAAQNVVSGAPYWSLDGNANASSTLSKLGTTNAINLRLFTNNLERVHINYSNGYVGIGTTAPTYKLHVANTANAIYGYTTGTTSVGVWGRSPYKGVYGQGGTYGIFGTGTYGVYGQGGTYGVYGTSAVSSGRGVYGNATGTSSAGVYGNNNNSSGIGVYGNSTSYIGVYGSGVYGLFGNAISGDGVWGFGGNIGTVGQGGTYGVYGYTEATSGTNYGVYGSNVSSTGYGVYGTNSSSSGTGVYGTGFFGVRADGGPYGVYGTGTSYGVEGIGVDGVVGVGSNTGVFGLSSASNGWGVYGYVNGGGGNGVYGYNTSTGYGVKAYCNQGSGVYTYSDHNYGLYCYTNSGGYAAYFGGPVFLSGGFTTSDKRLKQNITDVTNALDVINKLQPKSYEYRQDGDYKLMHMPTGIHYGLIAQDVEQVLPNLVKESEFDPSMARQPQAPTQSGSLGPDGKPALPSVTKQQPADGSEKINFKALNYTELIPILVKAIQEQQQEINQLKDQVSKLSLGQSINTIADNSLLDQNTPNPVNRSTSIRYSIPQGSADAQLILTNNLGQTIKTLRLSSAGTVNLDASTLSSGVYNYSLIVNGKVVETKKMTVARD